MLKVIIVDDEEKICLLIQSIVDWDELGLSVAGIARDGISAFKLIEEIRPEIVITDIRMPGKDGIELVRDTIEAGICTSFIIISGYRQFEYAHSALKYGVSDYILKPINKDALTAALKKASEKLRIEESSIAAVRSSMVNDILSDVDGAQSLDARLFGTGQIEVLMLKVNHPIAIERGESVSKIVEDATFALEQALKPTIGTTVTAIRHSASILVCPVKHPREERMQYYEGAFRKMMLAMYKYGGVSYVLGVGTPRHGREEIRRSLNAACSAAKCQTILGIDRVIGSLENHYGLYALEDVIPTIMLDDMRHAAEAMDENAVEQLVKNAIDRVNACPDVCPSLYLESCECLMETALERLRELFLENMDKADYVFPFDERLSLALDMESLFQTTVSIIRGEMNRLRKLRLEKERKPAEYARKYMDAHYSEALSLTLVADTVHLNPSYLSEVFSHEMGMSFTEYLTKLRLEKAKECLKDGARNIGEVATSVGYQDAKYFSRLFTRSVGITPQEYRKLYSRSGLRTR